MRKQMIENAAYEVATQVRAVEDSIEAALAEMAELQSRLVRARATTGVGVAQSHAVFEQMAAALQALVTARGGMANCHVALVETREMVPGLRTVSFGDVSECPPIKPSAQLRVVG